MRRTHGVIVRSAQLSSMNDIRRSVRQQRGYRTRLKILSTLPRFVRIPKAHLLSPGSLDH